MSFSKDIFDCLHVRGQGQIKIASKMAEANYYVNFCLKPPLHIKLYSKPGKEFLMGIFFFWLLW